MIFSIFLFPSRIAWELFILISEEDHDHEEEEEEES